MCRWRTYGSPPPKFPPNESILSYMRGAGCVFVRVVIAVLGRNSCVMRLLEKVVDVKDQDPGRHFRAPRAGGTPAAAPERPLITTAAKPLPRLKQQHVDVARPCRRLIPAVAHHCGAFPHTDYYYRSQAFVHSFGNAELVCLARSGGATLCNHGVCAIMDGIVPAGGKSDGCDGEIGGLVGGS
jgi:hypothetical protein